METKTNRYVALLTGLLTAGSLTISGCDNGKEDTPADQTTGASSATTPGATSSNPGSTNQTSQPGATTTPDATTTNEEPGDAPKTLAELAISDPQFSTLVTALKAADMVDALQGAGPLTVFAPTNAAFAALPAGALDSLLADKEKLKTVLAHHVVASRLESASLGNTPRATSLAGFPLLVDTSSGVKVGPATVTAADLSASNGVLHVVDQVILPPSDTIVELAKATPELSTLVTAVAKAELVDALNGPGPLTVFAPTNKAFDALPAGTLDSLLKDKKALGDVLKNHVSAQALYASDLKDGQTVPTLLGAEELPVSVSATGVTVGGAKVVSKDILATNGVVHVIDVVIEPPAKPKSIPELAIDDPRFSTLVKALKAADLVDAVSGKGPLTVFAPTNDAFDKLPKGVLEDLLKPKNKEKLKTILLHHVVGAKVLSTDLPGTPYAKSKAGYPLLVSTDGGAKISNAKVIEADLEASNGVVHAVDEVILPPSKNIVEIASENKKFKTLVKALKRARLVDTLKGDGPFTVFAPTDEAFHALPHGKLGHLMHRRSRLKNVLLFHVAGKTILSADLKDGTSIETLLKDEELSVEIESGKVKINGALVSSADILATNGVIHVIDEVLLPEDEK